MMHFVEIFLFQQLLMCSFCLFGHYYRLVELLFQLPNFIFQILALLILKGYFLDSFGHGPSFLHLVPLLLEIVEGVIHLVLDEEFPEEEIDCLALGLNLDCFFAFWMRGGVQNCCLVLEMSLSISLRSFWSTLISLRRSRSMSSGSDSLLSSTC